ncbi:MAG: polyprenyl synthetase family protein [Pseudonocardia sp.]
MSDPSTEKPGGPAPEETGPFGLSLDAALAADARERLADVEALLLDCVRGEDPLLSDASKHLVEAGGKRFRPMLVLLASHFGDPSAPGIVPAAVVVELTHLGTLYHDDVMDEATVRRGQQSANSRWTNTVAILTGDYLFARASDLLADLGPDAVRIQARAFGRLVRGQIQETVGPRPGADQLEHYLQVVADKTASLIAVSGHFGALLAGARPNVVRTVTSACEKIGVAFQLSDDILDIASETEESGKTPGTDLREGVPTLPVLLARRSTDAADARLLELLDSDLTEDEALSECVTLLRAHPALAEARSYVQARAEEAKAALAPLPEGPIRTALESFADVVALRSA